MCLLMILLKLWYMSLSCYWYILSNFINVHVSECIGQVARHAVPLVPVYRQHTESCRHWNIGETKNWGNVHTTVNITRCPIMKYIWMYFACCLLAAYIITDFVLVLELCDPFLWRHMLCRIFLSLEILHHVLLYLSPVNDRMVTGG